MIASHLLNCWFLLLYWIPLQGTKRRKHSILIFNILSYHLCKDNICSKMMEFIHLFVISLTLPIHINTHTVHRTEICVDSADLEKLHSHIKCISAHCYRTWRVLGSLYKLIFQGFILSVDWIVFSAALYS